MILADTSVWIDHLRRRHAGLAALLAEGRIVVHPFVIGEIALGALRHRHEVLRLLAELPSPPVATHDDVLTVVGRHDLGGAGIGWIDAHLLTSALLGRVPLWTQDRRLHAVARRIGASWSG